MTVRSNRFSDSYLRIAKAITTNTTYEWYFFCHQAKVSTRAKLIGHLEQARRLFYGEIKNNLSKYFCLPTYCQIKNELSNITYRIPWEAGRKGDRLYPVATNSL